MGNKALEYYISHKDRIIVVNLVGSWCKDTSHSFSVIHEDILSIKDAFGLILYCRDLDEVNNDAKMEFIAFLNAMRKAFHKNFNLSSLHPRIKEQFLAEGLIAENELNNNLKEALSNWNSGTKTQFCKIPINLFLSFNEDVNFCVYIKLSENKFVKLNHEQDDVRDTVLRYHKEKELTDIFASEEDYKNFINVVKNKHSDLLFDPNTKVENKILMLEDTYMMIKSSLLVMGMTELNYEICKKMADSSLNLLQENQNIFSLIKKFGKNCPEGFKRALVSMFVSNLMLHNFTWASDQQKQKMNLGLIMSDMLLDDPVSEEIRKIDINNVTSEQKKLIVGHIKDVIATLDSHKTVPIEVLQIVEQHHERPDGKGLPYGITFNRFSQLSIFSLVANHFADEIFKCQFDHGKKDIILNTMKEQYVAGNFKKAMESLLVSFGHFGEAA